ncbi:MAG TPA: F0F1 ATP synthase subunit delta [Opitutaceae bacterium]|jgi:F-type H+-transporting ATPase subunit delta|nr:F0F1 ATP synthase subunit delta [Opitutaceae bacterium]
MSSHAKHAQQLARRLFKLSVVDGVVSAERVAGVLEYVEKHKPAGPLVVLKAYHRLIAAELAKSSALVEHAGIVSEPALQAIAAAMTKKYGRPVTASAREDKSLLAGLRVRVGDDVYEASVAGQLAALAAV